MPSRTLSGGNSCSRAKPFQSAHRPQPRFQPAMISLDPGEQGFGQLHLPNPDARSAAMHLTKIAGSGCQGSTFCPTIYRTDDGSYVVQGTTVTAGFRCGVRPCCSATSSAARRGLLRPTGWGLFLIAGLGPAAGTMPSRGAGWLRGQVAYGRTIPRSPSRWATSATSSRRWGSCRRPAPAWSVPSRSRRRCTGRIIPRSPSRCQPRHRPVAAGGAARGSGQPGAGPGHLRGGVRTRPFAHG